MTFAAVISLGGGAWDQDLFSGGSIFLYQRLAQLSVEKTYTMLVAFLRSGTGFLSRWRRETFLASRLANLVGYCLCQKHQKPSPNSKQHRSTAIEAQGSTGNV